MGFTERWEAPISELYASAKKGNSADAFALVDKIKRQSICSPAIVVAIGGELIKKEPRSDKMYSVYESVGLAAAQLGLTDWVNHAVGLLRQKFSLPESCRFARMQ